MHLYNNSATYAMTSTVENSSGSWSDMHAMELSFMC